MSAAEEKLLPSASQAKKMEDEAQEEVTEDAKRRATTTSSAAAAVAASTNGCCRSSTASSDCGGPTQAKVPKLCRSEHAPVDLTFNARYTTQALTHALAQRWSATRAPSDRDDVALAGAALHTEPFQLCLLPELLQSEAACGALVGEMVDAVQWSRKQMDLYEFYQSADLSNMAESAPLLARFLQLLRRDVRPWLERVTGLKLDYVSASCSMYTCGDYLLVHDDLLKDRQIAFIYYLSPWPGAEQWRPEQGGCLELFSSDAQCFPHFPVRRKIAPRNNQFAFFKVGARSFHQVGEVTSFDYPRLTINGWFHGATNEDLAGADVLRPFSKLAYREPTTGAAAVDLVEQMVNQIYLTAETRESIQRRIEDNSEICLYEFLRYGVYEQVLQQLLHDASLQWHRRGPANAQNYEVLALDTAGGSVAQLAAFFGDRQMFALLRDYTDLDLAGAGAATPSYMVEVQRWSHGNYTMLGDGAISEENTLDLIYYLNASEGAAVITYLSPDAEPQPSGSDAADSSNSDEDDGDAATNEADDSVLLTITPIDNALNIVYRCEGTTKFTKYVSRNTPLDKGPVFVIFCSYKE